MLPTVRPAVEADLPGVAAVLEQWLVDDGTVEPFTGDVAARIGVIADWLAGRRADVEFFVADAGGVVGVGGLQSTGIDPELVHPGERPVEVITTYVHRDHRGAGVGRAILEVLERRAAEAGFTALIVVSGSRNRESGYPFWHRRYGAAVRWDDDYFGPGQVRVVWRRELIRIGDEPSEDPVA